MLIVFVNNKKGDKAIVRRVANNCISHNSK